MSAGALELGLGQPGTPLPPRLSDAHAREDSLRADLDVLLAARDAAAAVIEERAVLVEGLCALCLMRTRATCYSRLTCYLP